MKKSTKKSTKKPSKAAKSGKSSISMNKLLTLLTPAIQVMVRDMSKVLLAARKPTKAKPRRKK